MPVTRWAVFTTGIALRLLVLIIFQACSTSVPNSTETTSFFHDISTYNN